MRLESFGTSSSHMKLGWGHRLARRTTYQHPLSKFPFGMMRARNIQSLKPMTTKAIALCLNALDRTQ
jgi:hypothetical protein